MASEEAHIRPYRPADLDDLYRICLLTADGGEDATPLFPDRKLPGEVFAAPYGVFEPSSAFVAEDAAGVAGYIVGAADTPQFERTLERDWWPRLRDRYPAPPADAPKQELTREQRMANYIHHPPKTPAELAARYPSHLHIDLLPRLQGRGLGRRLIATFTTALRDRGSQGVHLHVSRANPRAIAFYRHVGFTDLTPIAHTLGGSEPDDVRLFAMDLSSAP
jgi:ribosomal protein S18 acetylase RimI-like enzyme